MILCESTMDKMYGFILKLLKTLNRGTATSYEWLDLCTCPIHSSQDTETWVESKDKVYFDWAALALNNCCFAVAMEIVNYLAQYWGLNLLSKRPSYVDQLGLTNSSCNSIKSVFESLSRRCIPDPSTAISNPFLSAAALTHFITMAFYPGSIHSRDSVI